MTTTIHPICVNHMNVVLENVEPSAEHLRQLYGAEFLADLPQTELRAFLMSFGRVLFEFFVPHAYLLYARYGPHYLGIEYRADMEVSRKAVAERGIRILRDVGVAIHTDPADAFGVSFEFTDLYFHDMEWPALGRAISPLEYWRDEHPLGATGLVGYTVAVEDADKARAFFLDFLGGEVVYDEPRPQIAARTVGLKIADAVMELLTPTGPGPVEAQIRRYGEGVRSTVIRVRDLEQARRYFKDRKTEVVPGSAPGRLMIPAEANLGVIFEFSE